VNDGKTMTDLGPIGKTIETKLKDAFAPSLLHVIDESHHHAGHAGHAGAHALGESHFRIRLSSDVFQGKSRVAQHRMVNDVLAQELKTRVHALAIEIV
jgi:BolA family transcriptional regulator, general stress-responsive regulator